MDGTSRFHTISGTRNTQVRFRGRSNKGSWDQDDERRVVGRGEVVEGAVADHAVDKLR
jgi:hypothetical protein